nr:uncharacterized protein LOC127492132 [Oryctolagus cuniculus]XP_051706706.1 uncharacterized protein LOC127492132 [Oryctolagus cuniculus]
MAQVLGPAPHGRPGEAPGSWLLPSDQRGAPAAACWPRRPLEGEPTAKRKTFLSVSLSLSTLPVEKKKKKKKKKERKKRSNSYLYRTSKTTEAESTGMNKTEVSAVPRNGFHVFLLLEVCLNPSLPIKLHTENVFSKLRLSLAAPHRFWKCMYAFKRTRGRGGGCLLFLVGFCVCSHLLSIHCYGVSDYSSASEIALWKLEVQFQELSSPGLWFQHSISWPLHSIHLARFLQVERDRGFTALHKYDHLLAPTSLCPHSFSARLSCPLCLTQSINVNCPLLKLTLRDFGVGASGNYATSTDLGLLQHLPGLQGAPRQQVTVGFLSSRSPKDHTCMLL